MAANFDRALRLNAGAFAGRLADRDQQEADGPNNHDCETWHVSLLVTHYRKRLSPVAAGSIIAIYVWNLRRQVGGIVGEGSVW